METTPKQSVGPVPSVEGTGNARCELCGELMPAGETMFKFHGYSGPCPKPIKSVDRKIGATAAEAAPSPVQTYVVGMIGLAKTTDNLADAAFWRDRATRAEAERDEWKREQYLTFARAEKAEAERDELRWKLRDAEITLRGRAHPADEPRDPPDVLRTLGFWPDCGCGECYAIHCLDKSMCERDTLREEVEALRKFARTILGGG